MGNSGDEGQRTMECLRGRLLAEREASKAAKAEAELMAKRVVELERQLGEEIRRMKRAERRMRYALKKLEPINFSGSSESSSSNLRKCGLGKGVGEGSCGDDGELSAAVADALRHTSMTSKSLVCMKPGAGRRIDSQPPVLAGGRPPPSCTYKPEIKSNINVVNVNLSHAREQLRDSAERQVAPCSLKELCSQ